MKLFICTDHDAVCPTGVASVVVARDEEEARILLRAALKAHGQLNPDTPFTLQEVPLDQPQARILQDGDY